MSEETSAALADPWLNRLIDQRYRVLERIGQGGMGIVYRVEHVRIGKVAAMKLLHASMSADAAATRRFHNEAEAISKLNHPNIVQVFDFGQIDRTLYLVMEYLPGENLGTVLERDGPRPLSRSVPLFVQVCDALTEAHSLGIVHRDLKPENIQIAQTKSGHDFVKVLDFGLAKMLQLGDQSAETNRGALVGTPYYMAPEQIRGRPLDERCDVYGLGAVLFRVLTGKPPFSAATPVGVLTKHITEALTPPSVFAPQLDIPAQIDSVLVKAMAKDREQRFASARQLKLALIEAANSAAGGRSAPGGSGAAPTGGTPTPGPSRTADLAESAAVVRDIAAFEGHLRRARWLRGLLLLALPLALVGIAYAIWLRPRPQLVPTNELEPNNTPDRATLLALGRPVTGQLGKRLSPTESDRDWYRIQLPTGTSLLHAHVTAIPNMDLMLELYDARGQRLSAADSTAAGGAETLTDWPVGGGPHYLVVREFWRDGTIPNENVTDRYHLSASTSATVGWEHEPNDGDADANELLAQDQVQGYLGAADDVDIYRIKGVDGPLAGTISAIAGVDLVVELLQAGSPARHVDAAGSSVGENFAFRPRGNAPLVIRVRRKESHKADSHTCDGLDDPYVLRVWRGE